MKKNIWDYRFEEIPQAYYEVWKDYAILRANYEMLDESKKSVIASEMSKVEIPEWLKDSESYRERIARQSTGYKKFISWYQSAIQLQLEKKYELDSLNMLFEFYRSTNSLEKSKTKIL